MEIKKILDGKQIVLLVLPSRTYGEKVLRLVKQSNHQKLLYVTLNNPYTVLVELYKKNGIEKGHCFFIDGISASNKIKRAADDCIFIDSPSALTQLSIAITQVIKTFKPEIMIFDSLSTLLIYLPEKSIIAFQQSLSTKLKGLEVRVLFPILENKELINNISMFVDDVVEWM